MVGASDWHCELIRAAVLSGYRLASGWLGIVTKGKALACLFCTFKGRYEVEFENVLTNYQQPDPFFGNAVDVQTRPNVVVIISTVASHR